MNGRVVKELGGILPDTVVESGTRSGFFAELIRKAVFFKFATLHVAKNGAVEGDVTVTDDVLKQFEEYARSQKFEYAEPVEKQLSELKEMMKKERYASASIASVDALLLQLNKEKSNAFERYKNEIRNELAEELNGRYNGEKGRIRISLNHDAQVQTAVSLLTNVKAYNALLKPKK